MVLRKFKTIGKEKILSQINPEFGRSIGIIGLSGFSTSLRVLKEVKLIIMTKWYKNNLFIENN